MRQKQRVSKVARTLRYRFLLNLLKRTRLSSANLDNRITGAAMDVPIPRRLGARIAFAIGAVMFLLMSVTLLCRAMPRGLRVAGADIRLATVERGVFLDDVVVRANAAPMHSVLLDSVESGRVEEVFARDGMLVKQGKLLFRLSNSQRRLDLLARQSERAQQISNLANLRVALEASQTEHQRRLVDLSFLLLQAQKQQTRAAGLAEQGFIAPAAFDDSADRLAQQRRVFENEKASGAAEIAIKRDAVMQMERAILGLDAGLRLLSATLDALAVRAPVAGRLTDFALQIGQTVKADQQIGRIDDPLQVKLSAQLEEFYFGRLAVGRRGSARVDGHDYAIEVARIYPQIKEGRFAIELRFVSPLAVALSPGQSVDVHISLGEPAAGLLLPDGVYLSDSGGAWVFKVEPDGSGARRRAIQIGRRNSSQVLVQSGLLAGDRVVVSSYIAYGKAERLQFHQ